MYFKDDWYILNQAINYDFWHWFNPFIDDVYRPIGAELFFWILHFVGRDNFAFAYLLVGITFLVGVYFLYRSAVLLSKNNSFSLLLVFFYALHSSRAYQLLWLGAFPETLMATFVFVSFYFWIKEHFVKSLIFFVLALLSKETVVVYPFIFGIYEIYNWSRLTVEKRKKHLISLFSLISFCFLFMFIRFDAMQNIAKDAEYVIHLTPKLWINNLMWYVFWSLGIPAFWSDMFPSIFSAPIAKFWEYLQNPVIFAYSWLLVIWISVMLIVVLKKIIQKYQSKSILKILFLLPAWIGICLLPVLGIIHKWPIRLSVPSVIVAVLWAYLYFDMRTAKLRLVLVLYLVLSLLGWKMNWNISTYDLEYRVAIASQNLFLDLDRTYNKVCVFDNLAPIPSRFLGVEKVKTSWHNQEFLHFLSKNNNLKTIYSKSSIMGCEPKSLLIDVTNLVR